MEKDKLEELALRTFKLDQIEADLNERARIISETPPKIDLEHQEALDKKEVVLGELKHELDVLKADLSQRESRVEGRELKLAERLTALDLHEEALDLKEARLKRRDEELVFEADRLNMLGEALAEQLKELSDTRKELAVLQDTLNTNIQQQEAVRSDWEQRLEKDRENAAARNQHEMNVVTEKENHALKLHAEARQLHEQAEALNEKTNKHKKTVDEKDKQLIAWDAKLNAKQKKVTADQENLKAQRVELDRIRAENRRDNLRLDKKKKDLEVAAETFRLEQEAKGHG